MLTDEKVIQLCIRHTVTVEQYFFMWMLKQKDFHRGGAKSLIALYTTLVRKYKSGELNDLIEKGFIDDFNKEGEFLPEMYMLKPKAEIFFKDDLGEELFAKYPAQFPLYDKGSSFLARVGGNKEELMAEYERKIGFSVETHKEVLRKLAIYVDLVLKGKLNGQKISVFIRENIWESIEEPKQQTTSDEDI
jgi:hypothetical protein